MKKKYLWIRVVVYNVFFSILISLIYFIFSGYYDADSLIFVSIFFIVVSIILSIFNSVILSKLFGNSKLNIFLVTLVVVPCLVGTIGYLLAFATFGLYAGALNEPIVIIIISSVITYLIISFGLIKESFIPKDCFIIVLLILIILASLYPLFSTLANE
jgi:hypothetical protein